MAVSEVTDFQEVRELYKLIEIGVNEISERTHFKKDRIAADVYHSILIGQYKLFVIHDDDRVWGWGTIGLENGVAICEDLFIGKNAPTYLVDEFEDFLDKYARANAASTIMFTTNRRAWGRRLERQGYYLRCYVFAKDL